MQLLKIRTYQIKRDLGFLFFILAGLCSALAYFFFNKPTNDRWYFTAILIFMLFSFHTSRKDLNFVTKNLVNPFWQLVTEYQVFLLIFSVPALFTHKWYCFFVIQLVGFLIATVTLKGSNRVYFKSLSKFIPPQHFEWIAGIRRNFLLIIPCILVAIVLSPVKLFGLAALFLLNSIVFSFYVDGETKSMLTANAATPKQLLYQKIFFTTKNLILINLPLLIINAIFNRDSILINLIFLVYMCIIASLSITIKYNMYKPNTKLSTAPLFQLAMASGGVVYPPLAILTVLLCIKNYWGAIKNLNYYMDDNA